MEKISKLTCVVCFGMLSAAGLTACSDNNDFADLGPLTPEEQAFGKATGNFTNTTGEKITEYVNKVIDENKNLINLYQEQLSSIQAPTNRFTDSLSSWVIRSITITSQ